MKQSEPAYCVDSVHGSQNTESLTYILPMGEDGSFYCVRGSTNVNFTNEKISDMSFCGDYPLMVEDIEDTDSFKADNAVMTCANMEFEVNDYVEGNE